MQIAIALLIRILLSKCNSVQIAIDMPEKFV